MARHRLRDDRLRGGGAGRSTIKGVPADLRTRISRGITRIEDWPIARPVLLPTPRSMRRIALAGVIADTVIMSTGAAVRLSSSGLGCPDWPRCSAADIVASKNAGQTLLNTWIEFSNRLLNFPLVAITAIVFIAAWRFRPQGARRRDLVWLAAIQPVGVIAQAVIGGIVVLTKLNPAAVSVHFLVSAAIVAAAVALHVRCQEGTQAREAPPSAGGPRGQGGLEGWHPPKRGEIPGGRPPGASTVRSDLRVLSGALVAVTGLMLAAGTVVTGTGPLAGNAAAPRYKLPLEGVTQLHADVGWLMAGLAVALVVGLRMSGAPPRAVRASWIMIASLGVQGTIGYIQYFTHLPAGLVWVHVTGSVLVWIAVLRLFFAMRDRGPLTRPSPEPAQAAPYRQPEPLDR
jgi:heme a synthase